MLALSQGCGKLNDLFGRQHGTTTIHLRLAGPQGLTTSLAGGGIIYAANTDGVRAAAFVAADEQDVTMRLPNGTYNFHAVGWGSVNLTSTGGTPTTPRCGSTANSTVINGTPITEAIAIEIKHADCLGTFFSSANSTTGGTFAPLRVVLCNTLNDLTAATATNGCKNGVGPFIGSYKLVMRAFPAVPGGQDPLLTGEGIESACFSGPNADGAPSVTPVRVPTGGTAASLFATELDLYPQSLDCSGQPNRFLFPRGLAGGSPQLSSKLVGDGSSNLSLQVNTSTEFRFQFSSSASATLAIGQPDLVTGTSPGSPAADNMSFPYGIATSPAGGLYVAPWNDSRILGYTSIPGASGASANFVLGQTVFTSSSQGNGANKFSLASGVSINEGKLAVADMGNNRVVLFNSVPTSNGPSADVVLGAAGFGTSGSAACTRSTFQPQDVTMNAGKMIVSDFTNNRVLIWNTIPSSNNAAADVILGSASCVAGVSATLMDHPRGAWTDGVRLAVSDTGNHRVLIWKSFPTADGATPDLVLGQDDFTTANLTGGAAGMSQPYAIWFSETQFAVADLGLFRVSFWNKFPTVNHQPADAALGQPNLNSGSPGTSPALMNEPAGIAVFKNKFFVSDVFNYRVLMFTGP